MTLTEQEKLKAALILELTYIDVNDKVTYLGDAYITAEVETLIRAELVRWDTAGLSFIAVEPKEANLGARINPDDEKADIRQRLAKLLYFTELNFAASTWGYCTRA